MSAVYPKEGNHSEAGTHSNHDSDAELIKSQQEYHRLVEEWAYYPAPERALFFLPLDMRSPEYTKRKVKARFCENIASHLKSIQVDQNNDGNYSERELELREEQAKTIVDGYLNLLMNFGVTGALFFSVLFGFVVNDITPSEESLNFFGEVLIKIFKYIFLAMVNTSVMTSLLLVFRSVQLYKHLSFWMPDIAAQMEWVKEISITSTVLTACVVVQLALVSIPFGAATAISPIAGLISLVSYIIILIWSRDILYVEERSELLLQRHAKRILLNNKKGGKR